jgi:hypothetical protein
VLLLRSYYTITHSSVFKHVSDTKYLLEGRLTKCRATRHNTQSSVLRHLHDNDQWVFRPNNNQYPEFETRLIFKNSHCGLLTRFTIFPTSHTFFRVAVIALPPKCTPATFGWIFAIYIMPNGHKLVGEKRSQCVFQPYRPVR